MRLHGERGGACAEIARELGVDAGSISDWDKRADAAQASPEDNPFKVAEENGTAVGILDQIHPMRLAPNPFGTAWGSCNPGRS